MWRSLLVGALGLAAMETALSLSSKEQGQLGKLLQIPGQWAEIFMDPTRPLVPNLSGSTGGSGSTSGGTNGNGSAQDPPPGSLIPTSYPHPTTPVVKTPATT
jgi:hypothetical protein